MTCIYIRIGDDLGARIELCGAVLLTELMQAGEVNWKFDTTRTKFYGTDSTIVLAWLQKSPSSWKTFIVIELQR